MTLPGLLLHYDCSVPMALLVLWSEVMIRMMGARLVRVVVTVGCNLLGVFIATTGVTLPLLVTSTLLSMS